MIPERSHRPPRSSTQRERRQREHELSIARRLIAFLRGRGLKLSTPTAGDPSRREPDAVCLGPRGAIGIEVTRPYYDAEHAIRTWTAARSSRERGARLDPSTSGQDTQLLDNLLVLLDRKLHKPYRLPTFLVLDASHVERTEAAGLYVPALTYTRPVGSSILAAYLALCSGHDGVLDFVEIPQL
ncbi:MAG: hypothetical protein IT305_27505 [Chloroflexi bacterium]|nr:hypothetical protein [Chloroflexota bacterium]